MTTPQTAAELRKLIRDREWTTQTSGAAPTFVQANLFNEGFVIVLYCGLQLKTPALNKGESYMQFKKNIGVIDRLSRMVAAVLFMVLIFTKTITGLSAVVLGFLAVIFFITSLVRFCPLYTFAGVSTCKKDGNADI